MYQSWKSGKYCRFEAGPSDRGYPASRNIELGDIWVDSPSSDCHESALSIATPKPRPLNLADDYEIVGGVPAFVWKPYEDDTPSTRVYAISPDGSCIVIQEGMHKICVYDMLDNFSLVAEWEDSNYERIWNFSFHNDLDNELVVVFCDSTVAMMHLNIKLMDPIDKAKTSQQKRGSMEITQEFLVLDNIKDDNQLFLGMASEGCETWVFAWDHSVRSNITLLSIAKKSSKRLHIKSSFGTVPTCSYISVSQRVLMFVSAGQDSNSWKTTIYRNVNFTDKALKGSQETIEYGKSFGFSECGRYFLVWRCVQVEENTIELYEVQSSTKFLYPVARRSIGRNVVIARGCFIKGDIGTIASMGGDSLDYPIVAFLVARKSHVRLAFWEPSSEEILKEIDLAMSEMKFSHPIHIEFCVSPNIKWVAVADLTNGTVILFSAITGSQVWSIKVNTCNVFLATSTPLKFDISNDRLIINGSRSLYVFCPLCFIEDYDLEFQSTTFNLAQNFGEQTKHLQIHHHFRIPKHILRQMLFPLCEVHSHNNEEMLDLSMSKLTTNISLLMYRDGFLIVLQGTFDIFFSLFHEYFKNNWLEKKLQSDIVELSIDKSLLYESQSSSTQFAWIFLYPSKDQNKDSTVIFVLQEKLLGIFIDFSIFKNQTRHLFSIPTCFAIKQTKDDSGVFCVSMFGVTLIDLKHRVVLRNVLYKIDLNRWLLPYVAKRGEGCFDIMYEGHAIIIGWDTKNAKVLMLTSKADIEECKSIFERDDYIISNWSVSEDSRIFVFLELNKNKHVISSICIYNIEGNYMKRITRDQWNFHMSRVIDSIAHHDVADHVLCFDQSNGHLWITVLKQTDDSSQLIFLPITPYSLDGCTPCLYMKDYPTRKIIELKELISQFGISFFNMTFNGKTNFQLALENKDKALMEQILSYSNSYGLSSQNVIAGSFDKYIPSDFLKKAIENNNEAGVAFFFDLLEKKSLPFEVGASLMKDEFTNLWKNYKDMMESRIMNNGFEWKICEIEVPIAAVRGRRNAQIRLKTIESISQWERVASQGHATAYWKSLNNEYLKKIEKIESNTTTTAIVVFFPIEDICKIGLKGIIRPLLMQEAPSYIFKAPLLKWVVKYKWEKVWKKYPLSTFIFYLIFMGLYSMYSIWIACYLGQVATNVCMTILLFILMIIASMLLYQEHIQIKTYINDGKQLFPQGHKWGRKKYWSALWNIVEVFTYIMAIFIIPSFHFAKLLGFNVLPFLYSAIALEAILIWIKVWYFAQAFKRTGAFVLMIETIIKNCLPFLALAFVILAGFSLALFVLFQHVLREKTSYGLQEENNEVRNMIERSFGDPWRTMVTMFYAMVGTFEPKVYYDSEPLSFIITAIFLCYLTTQMIVMVNMLIAIMGDTFDCFKSTEKERLLIGRARFIDACEAKLTEREITKIDHSIGKYLYVLVPKDEDDKDRMKLWQGKVRTIEDRVGRMIRDSEYKVMKKMEENNVVIKENTNQMHSIKDKIEIMKEDINEIKEMLRNRIT